MQLKLAALAAALATGVVATAAIATPMPPPTKPLVPAKAVAPALYTGRWYEIARTPNNMQKDCQAPTMDFGGAGAGKFQLIDTCHKGSPVGPKQTFNVSGRVLPDSAGAKMRVAMMGGLISQEYWVLECGAEGRWAIMSTPTGSYVWLLSRQPILSAPEKTQALARLQSLGFDLSRLAFPQQPPR